MSFLSRKATTASISALSAFAGLTLYTQTFSSNRQQKMLPSYEATFSVPLKCDSCVSDIKNALSKIDGSSSLSTFSIPPRLNVNHRHHLHHLLNPQLPNIHNLHRRPLNHHLHNSIHRPRRHPPRFRRTQLSGRLYTGNPPFICQRFSSTKFSIIKARVPCPRSRAVDPIIAQINADGFNGDGLAEGSV